MTRDEKQIDLYHSLLFIGGIFSCCRDKKCKKKVDYCDDDYSHQRARYTIACTREILKRPALLDIIKQKEEKERKKRRRDWNRERKVERAITIVIVGGVRRDR